MGALAFSLDIEFETVTCYSCGIPFAAPRYFFQKRRENHENFWCPNGHAQHFLAKSEAEKLRGLLDEEQRRHSDTLSRLNLAEKKTRKQAKLLKRSAVGVCTCCNRTFTNLARHMATQHPDQVPKLKGHGLP